MRRAHAIAMLIACAALASVVSATPADRKQLPAARKTPAPVLVIETTKGTIEIETFPDDAPKSVAHVVKLAEDGFYDGQRVHRAVAGFVVQWGDPRSRDVSRRQDWGVGREASSGQPVGVAEISTKHLHVKGAVGLAHPGVPGQADSQLFITLADRTDLDGRYAVIGQVIGGSGVPEQLSVGDLITRVSVRRPPPER